MQQLHKPFHQLRWQWVLVGLAICLVLVIYGPTMDTTYRKDDLRNVTWAAQQSWPDIWTKGQLTQLYRPLIASLRKLLATPENDFNLLPLKAVHVGLFIAGAVMTGQFAILWWRREPRISKRAAAVIATVLFITLPFAYECVPWASTIAHPLTTVLVLGAMLAYDRARRGGGAWWVAAAATLTLLAPLGHELGFLTGGFLILIEIRGRCTQEYRRIPYWLGGLGVAVIALYLVRQSLPGVLAMRDFSLSGERIVEHMVYLLQSATYPTALISGTLTARHGIDKLLSAGVVGLLTLLVLFVLLRRAARWVVWGTAALWGVLVAGLMGFFMPYLLIAPHYLVFLAPGAAVVWAGALAGIPVRSATRRHALVCALLLLCAIPGLVPVMVNIDHLLILDGMLGDIAETGYSAPPEAESGEKPLLFVNTPYALFPSPAPYPVGDFGTWVYMLPDFYPDQTIYMASGKEVSTQSAMFFNVLPDMPYEVGLLSTVGATTLGWEDMARVINDSSDVYLTQYEPDRIYLRRAGRVTDAPPNSQAAPVARFEAPGIEVALLAAGVQDVDGQLALRLEWAAPVPPATNNLEVFVHLYDGAGALVSQDDGPFLMGLYPLWMVSAGQHIEDYRYYSVPAAEVSEGYTIGIGIWNTSTGERLSPTDAAGASLSPDGMVHLKAIVG